MNIVLVCLNNFQEYILVNIQQLINLKHENIYVITNKYLENHFDNLKTKIKLLFVEDLKDDTFHYLENSIYSNDNFRGGFWKLTSYRLFVLYEFMKLYNIEDVIHLENDVPIYYNCDTLLPLLEKKYMYIPFDCWNRNIASIVYIPNHTIYYEILKHYNSSITDMENFSMIQKITNLIENFPIFKTSELNDEFKFVTKNYNLFKFIFDGAAIGQYLGGVDPRNIQGDTRGFINETCIIKYNTYEFLWKTGKDNINRPFLICDDEEIPIFNLHIHSKRLGDFCSV